MRKFANIPEKKFVFARPKEFPKIVFQKGSNFGNFFTSLPFSFGAIKLIERPKVVSRKMKSRFCAKVNYEPEETLDIKVAIFVITFHYSSWCGDVVTA